MSTPRPDLYAMRMPVALTGIGRFVAVSPGPYVAHTVLRGRCSCGGWHDFDSWRVWQDGKHLYALAIAAALAAESREYDYLEFMAEMERW